MRHARVTALLASLLAGCPSEAAPDAASPGRDAPGPDVPGLDAPAAREDAPGLDAPGLDAPGLDASTAAEDAPTRTVAFTPSDAIFANPERGFYRAVDLMNESDLSWLRGEHAHDSLVYSYVMLDRFRGSDISAATLDEIRSALRVAQDDGFEVVVRFAYNLGPYPDPEPDAPLSRIERHLEQLSPVLRENEGAIALVQAGLIGAWGEWHSSTHGLDADPAARRAVVEAVLAAVPASRSTQVRYPPYIGELVGGTPLDPSRAWDGSFAARVGYHNDCFLSSDTDVGTYPDDEIDRWKTFLDAHTAFVPVGGETCAPYPPRSECASALAEMERHHYSFLNRDYHPDIVQSWEDGGCLPEMERRLGYRLVLIDAELPEAVRPGGSFRLRLRVRNEGFAAPFNARPVELTLRSGTTEFTARLDTDVRRLLPGEHVIEARVRVPATVAIGSTTLSLRLPSAVESLAGTPAFSIRLANEDVWQAAEGENLLGSVAIDDTATGTVDPSATELTILD